MKQLAKIFVTRRLPISVEERMLDLFDTTLNTDDTQLTTDEILHNVANADVLVSSIHDPINAEFIAQLPPSLRLIAQFGNGVDNIDLEAAHARGITVTNTPSVLTDDTADMAMALILAVPRRLAEGAKVLLHDGTWPGWSPNWLLGSRLSGKSLGIIGMGRIGTAVAKRARAFGLNLHYYSRTRKATSLEENLGLQFWDDLDAMLAHVNILSIHTPHTPETYQILSAKRLRMLKHGAFLVNISRPELVDEAALIDLIQSGHLSGAALDVFANNKSINKDLLSLARQDKVILTPHMGSATLESRVEMGETVIISIRAFADGHQPPHRVFPDRILK